MRTNGLEAPGYVAVVDVHPLLVDALLEIFAAEGVAAYAAPVARERRLSLREDGPTGPTERLWVDRREIVKARAIVRARLPALRAELEQEFDDDADRAVQDEPTDRAGVADAPDTIGRRDRVGEVPALTGVGGAGTGGRTVPDVVDDEMWAQIVASIEGTTTAADPETDASAHSGTDADTAAAAETGTGAGHPWPPAEDVDSADRDDAGGDDAGDDAGDGIVGRRTATWEFRGGTPTRHARDDAPDAADGGVGGGGGSDRAVDDVTDDGWPVARARPRSTAPMEDADHFVPPPPPPLPEGDRTLRLAWGCVIGGPLLFLLAVIFQWELSSWAQLAGVAALVGGFITLVTRMRDDDDPYDPDHGAAL